MTDLRKVSILAMMGRLNTLIDDGTRVSVDTNRVRPSR
jgi:hypothetical protein